MNSVDEVVFLIISCVGLIMLVFGRDGKYGSYFPAMGLALFLIMILFHLTRIARYMEILVNK